MVIHAFPAAKLGALLLRQVSKPITAYLISRAKTHPFFRNYIIMPPAQLYNWCEIKTKMWILNLGKPINIPVLNETMAIELGANLLGEATIFVIAAVLLVMEYNRSSRKEERKETSRQDEINNLTQRVMDLTFQTEQQRAQIVELFRLIGRMDPKIVKDTRVEIPENDKPKDGGSPPAVQSNFDRSITSREQTVKVKDTSHQSIIANAINSVQCEMFDDCNKLRESGVLTAALNHFYSNVYKVPLTMC